MHGSEQSGDVSGDVSGDSEGRRWLVVCVNDVRNVEGA